LTVSHLENERLSEALKLASDIQMRMLPGATIAHEDEPFDLYASIRPAKMVGGDLYDFELSGNRLYFCIGDVSGKGIGSALIMALTKTLFRANVPYYEDAARLTEAVNLRLCEETGPTMFVTAFCGFLDLDDGTLRFCNAGHDRPFILHADGSVDLLESKPGLALGVLPKFKYPLQQMTLARGDALFLYTDGVTDATNAAEELFSADRVRDVLRKCVSEGASNVVDTVTRAVDQFVKSAPQADDITMMCIRYQIADRGSQIAGVFPRKIDSLPHVMDLVGKAVPDIDPKTRYAVELALEEIFTNMVKYNATGKGDIRVELALRDQDVVVTITDFDTPRFDPVSEAPQVDVNRPLEERREGGLGIHLVKQMMDRIEYSHQNRTGTITLRKRLN
jgi:sigma-B regulation protein RsbU (phosphoserine phosphatase)